MFKMQQNPCNFTLKQRVTTLDLPKTKLDKLQSMGIYYCDELTQEILKSLSIILQEPAKTKTALEILEEELLNGCILSFITELDKVLIDEIVPKRIIELAGFPGSGKTQICFQLCITTQLPKSLGGQEGEVIYISTNKNFALQRIKELIKQFTNQVSKLDSEAVKSFNEEYILKHLYVLKCSSMVEIFAAVEYLKDFLKDKQIKLIIIDSISNPLRNIDQTERTPVIYTLFDDLQHLATIFNFAIVVTNDFTTRFRDNEAYHTPSFGDSFFERVNSRICLSRKNDVFCAELVKSVAKNNIKVYYSMF